MRTHYYLRTITLAALAILLYSHVFAQRNKKLIPQPAIYKQKIQSSALLFMENKGQVADDKGNAQPNILFTANSGGAKVYLTATGIHYQFNKTEYPKGYNPVSKELTKDPQQAETLRKQIKTSTHHFSVELQGANPHPVISKAGQSSYYENYYLPQCPDGITGVHGYEKIVFKEVYPHIDWVMYSKGGFMEYDFLVHPGGNPAHIKLKIKDADKVSITAQGELLMQTSLGEVKEKAPVSYADGQRISSHFKQNSDGTIGFAVQAQPGKELRIDPSIVWSTYYGGSGVDAGGGCKTDINGNVFLFGQTNSYNVIASGGFQNSYGGGASDLYAVKFTNNGVRVWGTYCGGSSVEYANNCHIDVVGNLYLTGNTYSTNNIAFSGFQMVYGGGFQGDGLLEKIDNNGIRIWGTYYGGSGSDRSADCSTDANGNVYLTGSTRSANNIAFSGFQNFQGGSTLDYDAFLVKFDASGNRTWGTYYGGNQDDDTYACTVDLNGNVYIAGETMSASGIAYNGFQMTYHGGIRGGGDGLIVKFLPNGNRVWATYYGGDSIDYVRGCVTDNNGDLFIIGATESISGIALGGFQNNYANGRDAFLSKVSSSGLFVWGSYYGGSGYDDALSCTIDINGNIFFSGVSSSTSGIAVNGFQNVLGGSQDAFLAKIRDITCIAATQPALATTSDTICASSSTTLSIASGNLNSATTWQWRKDSCNGAPVGAGTSITVSPTATTTYFVKGEGGCAAASSCASKTIVVRPSLIPTVILSASPSGPITSGTAVTFTATSTNGGFVPFFAFNINGSLVQNGPSNVYTSNTLQNGDIVTVNLSSNAPCASPVTITSNAITIIVAAPCIPPTTPVISSNYDTVCTGTTATLTVTSGNLNSATNWQWYAGSCGGTALGNTNSITVTPSATTTYYLRAEGGCITLGACVSKTIYVKQKPVVTFTATLTSLCSSDTATIIFTGTAQANAIFSWNWGGGSVISGTGAGPYSVKYQASGSIGLTVNNGTCSVAAIEQAINVVPAPELTFNVSDSIGCDTLAVSLSANALNITSWTWDFGDGVMVNNVNTPVQHTYSAGSYIASVTVRRGACTTTARKQIVVYEKPTASFTTLPGINTPVLLSQANFSFINTSQNVNRYLWQFGDNTTSNLSAPVHRYVQAGAYAVKLFAYNAPACVDSFEVKPFIVLADTVPAFSIPNAFSPNRDGINDTWVIEGLQTATNTKVYIYNRWGQVVFNSVGYSQPWNGIFNNKPLPTDTYYYVITVGNKSYTGSVTLLR